MSNLVHSEIPLFYSLIIFPGSDPGLFHMNYYHTLTTPVPLNLIFQIDARIFSILL